MLTIDEIGYILHLIHKDMETLEDTTHASSLADKLNAWVVWNSMMGDENV